MPTIAFFSNQFARKHGTGVTRYAHNLLKGFKQCGDAFNVFPVATWSDRDPESMNEIKSESGLRLLSTGRRLTPLLWMTIGYPTIEQILNTPIDLVHACDLGIAVATSKPYIVTVHDLGPLIYPELFPKSSHYFMKKNLTYAVKKSSALVCVSHATADSLQEYGLTKYKIDLSSRIHVALEGITETFLQPCNPSVLEHYADFNVLDHPYILAVGKLNPRKNLETVIRALGELRERIPHHLITAGGDGWDFQESKRLVDELGLQDRIHFLGYVTDEFLHALYNHATLFVYPSLFEGFGLTILEAMASGCPVVASNIPPLVEVAKDAAILVEPKNVAELASAIESICLDDNWADELRRRGRERAQFFSWRNCAEEILSVYEGILNR